MKAPFLIEHTKHKDNRGYFMEVCSDPFSWVQDNMSFSTKGVLRGLHYQKEPYAQTKFCTVVKGKVLDVCVNIDKKSPDYLKIYYFILGEGDSLFIPTGFAHGFQALEDTYFYYKVDKKWSPKHEKGIAWNDPKVKVQWPLKPILSEKDQEYKFL